MTTFKCKMCGGELHIIEGNNICECEFCGTQQTIPTADNDKKVNLFNRANRLRMNAEFDKATTIYASITAEFPEEAEAYWGLCLCKYGIEYVDDPMTGNKVPTCHRTLTTSIMDDSDFDQACENADSDSKRLYREEAKAIDRLQQDILDIVASEEPFDVFICYKETDEDGERTNDSVIAQEIYDFLTEKGLKVFFARITLEDKLGKQYEPYIYAALHSAKVMLAVGTKYEYYDAVWVKNEWARYLDMMRTDKNKALIPCFKGIDAYDMPREFKNLQALDMGKIGWKQDLVRGIIKLTGVEEKVIHQSGQQYVRVGANVENLMKRARLFMEDGEFDNAKEYLDKVLDENAEHAPAYVAKVCIALGIRREEDLRNSNNVFVHNSDWKKAIRFATPEQKAIYHGYVASVLIRIIKKNIPEYETAEQCRAAKGLLASYEGYEGVPEIIRELDLKIESKDQYEQRMSSALEIIKELRDKHEEALAKYHRRIKELNSQKDKQKELSRRIQESVAIVHALIQEELAIKGMFSGKRKKEIDNRRTAEERKQYQLRKQIADEENNYNQGITAVEREKPGEEELEYSIAKVYYEHALYEEATITYYKIVSYRDVRNIVNEDENIAKATRNLIEKAIQHASDAQKPVLIKVAGKDFLKEENGYNSQEVNIYLNEIIIKTFAVLNAEEKANTIIDIRKKEFDTEENGYSKKEIRNLLGEVLSCCYGSDPRALEQQFVSKIKTIDSMIEIYKLWEHFELRGKYPAADSHIRKLKDQERLYGRLRNIEGEKRHIESMIGI